jgi:hypothetical protein
MQRLACLDGPSVRRPRLSLALTVATAGILLAGMTVPVAAATGHSAGAPQVAYNLNLPGGQTAMVFNNGVAAVFSSDHKKVEFRTVPLTQRYDELAPGHGLPDKAHLIADLAAGANTPFVDGRVLVVFANGVTAARDLASGRGAAITNDAPTNGLLQRLGVDQSERLFRQFDRPTLTGMRTHAEAALGRPLMDFSNAYRLHVTGASVHQAVLALLQSPNVVYASPDWRVRSTGTTSIPLTSGAGPAPAGSWPAGLVASPGIPSNYAVATSAQSLLNAPGTDAVAAFDEIDRQFHQLPGQGEIITNVSLGDLTDASVINNFNDPCGFYATVFGPTSVIIGGQRYLNLPSMPLIPAYTSDPSGKLSGTAEVCGIDPFLGEVGLDFSMMAPLPHAQQRPGEQGTGLTDLLGIAPGASYRLVVPAPAGVAATISDIDGSFLGAGMQSPAPNVITASLGFGVDQFGFSGRYLEDDPLTEAIIASLVKKDIAVTVSSGDGLRTFTNAPVAPSGGSARTDVIPNSATPSDLNDVAFSGAPSRDHDSGSIDVGGTTLDDINSAPPQDPANHALVAQHAFPETRWNGFTLFSSGYGSRVNVSAPSDNVLGLSHSFGGAADSVDVSLNGGTSASAPETAAAVAVILQVARLTGQTWEGDATRQLREFLVRTATAVPNVPQSDVSLDIGPQINVRRAVEDLLAQAGLKVAPTVGRVAVEQRRNYSLLDAAFLTATDPSNINLQGPTSGVDGTMTGRNARAWITIAPDWEGLPQNAHYQLTVGNARLASTPWARLLPEQILGAAGLPLASPSSRTVTLTYRALSSQGGSDSAGDGKSLAQSTFSLTFGPADATSRAVLAPIVPAVVSGATIPVTYDLSSARNVLSPTLLVSEPGHLNAATGFLYRAVYSAPLGGLRGTVQVPVSALQGGGIYGINIRYGTLNAGQVALLSDVAYTRVTPTGSARPGAPLVSVGSAPPGHFAEIPFGGSFRLNWDVSGISGSDGATLEVSAPGPGTFNNYNPFNNPNGSIRDANGIDTGSTAFIPLSGTKGSVALNGKALHLVPTVNHVVRVLATRAGSTVGEAGEVSTVTMDGVFAADGGYANNGWGINQNGTDAFLTSGQQLASGQVITSLETFDQATNAITKTVASATNSLYFTNGWGIWGGDVGVEGLFDLSTFNSTYNLLNPATGTLGAPWTPPSPATLTLSLAAANPVNDQAALLAYDSTAASPDTPWRILTSKITANTFGPLINLSPAVSSFGLPTIDGIGQNTTTNQAAASAADFFNFCGPPTIVTADLTSGTVSSFAGVTSGFPYGIAVDSSTNRAVVPTVCDGHVGIYDLATRSGIDVSPQGSVNIYPAVDQTRGLIVMDQVVPSDFGVNNNAMSSAVVLDEAGNVLAVKEQFYFFNSFLTIGANNLQVNPSTRSAYTFGPFQQQLEPFSY